MQTDGELEPQPVGPSANVDPLASGNGFRPRKSRSKRPIDPLPVLAAWQEVTGTTLNEQHRVEFLSRPATSVLADQPLNVLQEAGQRLWQRRGRLDLLTWVLEADWPGLPDVTVRAADLVTSSSEAGLELRELVAAALSGLRLARDRRVLAARLGLDERESWRTLQEIGEELGVSRERIRTLQDRALETLGTKRSVAVPRAGDYCRQMLDDLLTEIDSKHRGRRVELLLDAAESAFPQVPPGLAVSALVRLAGRGKNAGKQAKSEVSDLIKTRKQEQKRVDREKAALQRADGRVVAILGHVEWSGYRVSAETIEGFVPQRTATEGRWYSGKLAREVSYDSGLELSVMQLLDRCSQVVQYCEQPLTVEYEIDGKTYPYYPDLLLLTDTGDVILVEIKPLVDMGFFANRVKWDAARRECARRGWGFLATDGYRSFATVAGFQVPDEIRDRFRQRLQQGTMYWPDIRSLRGDQEQRYLTLPALVIQEGWDLRRGPYRLSLGS
ncbi:TnsA endonuclease N-terminal domain-containing protein [Actinocorallia libanotica]|uniref:Sigma-70-like protein n=1 Tax=Actinocorallia libanotica TaxID=46162 RepID=A0ABP4CCW3_9ACTN